MALRIICSYFFILLAICEGQLHAQTSAQHPEAVIVMGQEAYRKAIQSGFTLSVDKVLKNDSVRVYIAAAQLGRLDRGNIAYRKAAIPSLSIYPRMADYKGSIDTAWDYYPTYSAYLSILNQLVSSYPQYCRLEEIATLSSGRKILALVISDNIDSAEAEPKFLYTSSIHGDETVGFVLMLRLAHYLLYHYGSNADITQLVDNMEIWINPLANPDGAYHSGNNNIFGATRGNANGVDLNRNYPDPQDGPNPDGNVWQEETMAFMDLAQNEGFNISCNIHGGAEVCNYPWDTWSTLPADEDWWIQVCNEYADTAQAYSPSGYMDMFGTGVSNGYAWYSINGGRQDYMNYFQHCREFTLEISNSKFPPASSLDDYWMYNYRSFLNYLEQGLYGISGIVRDSISGQPVKALVSINGHDFDSSEVYSSIPHGNYYRYLAPGYYDLTYSAPGYYSKTINGIPVQAKQATNQDVYLRPKSSNIPGRDVGRIGVIFNSQTRTLILDNINNVNIIELKLLDMRGRLLLHEKGAWQSYQLSREIPPGFYIIDLRFQGSKLHFTKKLVLK